MPTETRFADIVEQAHGLPVEDQEELVGLLQSRLRDRRRVELAGDVAEAQRELRDGGCRPATAQDLMRDIVS